MRPYAFLLAVITLAVVAGGEAQASTMPDSQAAICSAGLDRISAAGGHDLSQSETIGRMVDLLFLRVVATGLEPWRFRYHPRVDFFSAAIKNAAEVCPNFAPYSGTPPGHLRLSPRMLSPYALGGGRVPSHAQIRRDGPWFVCPK